jgi:hypothetical protein
LRVFDNRVLRRIFGSKREEVVGGWRRLHNEELHNIHSLPHIIRVMKSSNMRWSGLVAPMGEMRNVHKCPVRKPEGKKPLERPRRKWEDNIEVDLTAVGWDGMVWIHPAQDPDQWRALVNTVINIRVP